MNECHESRKLNKLIGKTVKVTFTDGDARTGRLERTQKRYCIAGNFGNMCSLQFYKTHVKKVEEA